MGKVMRENTRVSEYRGNLVAALAVHTAVGEKKGGSLSLNDGFLRDQGEHYLRVLWGPMYRRGKGTTGKLQHRGHAHKVSIGPTIRGGSCKREVHQGVGGRQ